MIFSGDTCGRIGVSNIGLLDWDFWLQVIPEISRGSWRLSRSQNVGPSIQDRRWEVQSAYSKQTETVEMWICESVASVEGGGAHWHSGLGETQEYDHNNQTEDDHQ